MNYLIAIACMVENISIGVNSGGKNAGAEFSGGQELASCHGPTLNKIKLIYNNSLQIPVLIKIKLYTQIHDAPIYNLILLLYKSENYMCVCVSLDLQTQKLLDGFPPNLAHLNKISFRVTWARLDFDSGSPKPPRPQNASPGRKNHSNLEH